MQITDMQHIPKIGATSSVEHQGVKFDVSVVLSLLKCAPILAACLCGIDCKRCKDVSPARESPGFRMVPSPKSLFHFQEKTFMLSNSVWVLTSSSELKAWGFLDD